MKIFIDHQLSYKGGIYIYFKELFKKLKAKNISFHIDYYDDLYVENGLQKTFFSIKKPRLFERIRACRVNDANSFDIFHSSYYRVPYDKKIKVVTTVHDFTHEKYFSFFKKIIHHFFKMRAIRRADAIICVSETTKTDLMYFYKPGDNQIIKTIYNGISDDFYNIAKNKHSYSYKNQILFVGSRANYKNWNLALKLISSLNGYKLVVVGGGEDKKSFYKNIPKSLHKIVDYQGFVTNTQLNELYNDAFCLFYPSSYEGFGIPVIEAMAAGCPVIANENCKAIKEIGNNIPIFFDPAKDPYGADAFKKLHDIRERLIEKGINHASKFSWENSHNSTIKLYQYLYNIDKLET